MYQKKAKIDVKVISMQKKPVNKYVYRYINCTLPCIKAGFSKFAVHFYPRSEEEPCVYTIFLLLILYFIS